VALLSSNRDAGSALGSYLDKSVAGRPLFDRSVAVAVRETDAAAGEPETAALQKKLMREK